jgi:hypothetical protein
MEIPVEHRTIARRLADQPIIEQVEFWQSYANAYQSIYGANDKMDDEFMDALPATTAAWFNRMFRAAGRMNR